MSMVEYTTIRIKKDTKVLLEEMMHPRESYEDTIIRLVSEVRLAREKSEESKGK